MCGRFRRRTTIALTPLGVEEYWRIGAKRIRAAAARGELDDEVAQHLRAVIDSKSGRRQDEYPSTGEKSAEPSSGSGGDDPLPPTHNTFKLDRDDSLWDIEYAPAGERGRVKSLQGFYYLRPLLNEPRKPWSCEDLEGLGRDRPAPDHIVPRSHFADGEADKNRNADENTSPATGSQPDTRIDLEAKKAYKKRLDEIDSELADAERNHDEG